MPIVRVLHEEYNAGQARVAVPVRIPAGTLGATRDVFVTSRHGVVHEGILKVASSVPGVARATDEAHTRGVQHYYHLQLPSPEHMLVADGVAAELATHADDGGRH